MSYSSLSNPGARVKYYHAVDIMKKKKKRSEKPAIAELPRLAT